MSSKNRTYLVDIQNLTPDKRARTKELLDVSCWMSVTLAKQPHIIMAHTACSADEFAALPFPEGCIVTDVTGQDLLSYR